MVKRNRIVDDQRSVILLRNRNLIEIMTIWGSDAVWKRKG